MQRHELHRLGDGLRERVTPTAHGTAPLGGCGTAPGFEQMMTEAVYGGVWARPGLALDERMICTLAVMGLRAPSPQLASLVDGALDLGLAPRSILEVFVHCGLYGGFVTTESACAQAHGVFEQRGVTVPREPRREASLDELTESGREVMTTLHGDRATGGYAAPDDPVTGGLYALAICYGYGELWSRTGLDHRQRLLCAIAAFTALGLESQLVKFALAAMDNGFQRDQVVEAVIQTAPYGGFPRALNALGALSRALRARP